MAKPETLDPMALGALASGGALPPSTAKLLEKYLQTATESLEAQVEKQKQEEETIRKQFLQMQERQAKMAMIAEETRLAQEKAQELCAHVNERGGSLVQGQRLGAGKFSLRCQSCGKQYTEWSSIPLHLRPKGYTGGPTNY